jgi:hypothetical protein
MNAALEWIDAKTPHAKVLRSNRTSGLSGLPDDPDVQAAVVLIEQFQTRLRSEAQERPLVVIESR